MDEPPAIGGVGGAEPPFRRTGSGLGARRTGNGLARDAPATFRSHRPASVWSAPTKDT
jgi:hypothetical protein